MMSTQQSIMYNYPKSQAGGDSSMLSPILDSFQHQQKERDRKKSQYIKDLKEQMISEVEKKKKQKHQEKEADKAMEDKINRDWEVANQRSAGPNQQSNTKLNRIEESQSVRANSQKIMPTTFNQQQPLAQSSYFSSTPQKNDFKLPPIWMSELKPFQSSLPSKMGYLRAKQGLEEERQKLVLFRDKLSYQSRRNVFALSAQSALESLKLLTSQVKNSSSSSPFILPVGMPRKTESGAITQIELRSVNEYRY